jgi:double-stranded RNA-binding protein Staufen
LQRFLIQIQHQYTLTDEQGPAHKKTFFVKLKLGEEQYAASGPSIKKGQHAAAAEALKLTAYKHPPAKPAPTHGHGEIAGKESSSLLSRYLSVSANPSITPTVELNALAMKRGEPAVYRPIEPSRPVYYPPPNLDFRGMYHQRSVFSSQVIYQYYDTFADIHLVTRSIPRALSMCL